MSSERVSVERRIAAVEGKYCTMRPWPIVPVEMLERSVDNLERLVTSG